VTFTNAPPFDILGLPECASGVKPKMELYLPPTEAEESPQCDIVPVFPPEETTTSCMAALRADKRVTRVAVVIHGFLKSFETEWLHDFQKDIQAVEPNNTAVLVSIVFMSLKLVLPLDLEINFPSPSQFIIVVTSMNLFINHGVNVH